MRKRPKYVSLFSGAGGLDIGLERAGLQAVSLCEVEGAFCDSLRANQAYRHEDGHDYLSGARVCHADIRDVSARDLTRRRAIDLVVGGPPCQAFSSAGKQLSVLDARGLLVNEFVRLVDEIKPKVFLFENVRGLVTARDSSGEPGGVMVGLVERFHEIGYSCRATLLNAADFGSYQRRIRCFIVASRNGSAPCFPAPTHQKEGDLMHARWRSLGDFLERYADRDTGNFTFPTSRLADQLAQIPDGSGVKSMGKAEPTRPGGHWGYRQGTFIADQALPARTVTGSSSQDWVRHEGVLRRLTLKEVMQLQGFPTDWIIKGTKAQAYKQVGNAVPAIFGEVLGGVIKEHLAAYPTGAPETLPLPREFRQAVNYTKRDHARNASARSAHMPFED